MTHLEVEATELPANALLHRYREAGHFTDCYVTTVPGTVTHADYVAAFYTTRLFKLERLILRWVVRKPSTDAQAVALGRGEAEAFAAWTVEARAENQILLRDLLGSTASWLMVAPRGASTALYFGSAAVLRGDPRTGQRQLSWRFRALLGFHRRYSLALLRAAHGRVLARAGASGP